MTRLALIQTKHYSSNQEGIISVAKKLARLGKAETDIVCLPEQWLIQNTIVNFEVEFDIFLKIAREYGMTIIPGAFYEKNKKSFVITAPVIGPKGEVIGRQNKIHPYGYEKNLVTHGKTAKIFKTKCRFGVAICYDMIFPQVTNKLVRKGAEVIFSPSRIVKHGISPWRIYLQTRSLENRVPIVAANVDHTRFGGNSTIVDLYEKKDVMIPRLYTSHSGETSIVKNLDLVRYLKSRKSRFQDTKSFS